MTPMIDVVFLLIIFFLVSSHLARQENDLELPLPIAQEGIDMSATAGERVTISVTQEGELLLGGQPLLPDELTRRLRVENERAKNRHEPLAVRIRSDRHVVYAKIKPLLNACQAAGISSASFSVIRQEEEP